MTYSIVALDPATRSFGVGVQTHQPCVGSIVPWVDPDWGAVATQSFANINFGPQGLALLAEGLDAPRTLAALVAGDDLPARRQVAVIDNSGRAAVHTGDDCIPFAGHVVGPNFSAQANMMTNEGVPEAMAGAFESTPGNLAERIMAALEAAQTAGGDIRGSQSAAILVREPGPRTNTWDLRIDNSSRPMDELRQLLNVRLAGQVLDSIEGRAELPELDAAYGRAHALYPSDEQLFWFAVNQLATRGFVEEAASRLIPLFERAPQWQELLHRLRSPAADTLRGRFRS